MGNKLRANLNRLAHALAGSRVLLRALMLALIPAVMAVLIAFLGYVRAQPPAASPASAPTNANWCADAPASPPPPGFELRPGDWPNVRKMCAAHMHDRGCVGLCAFAEELWRRKKAGQPNQPSTAPSPSDQPQGPFPLPGGASGYILPVPPSPTPGDPTSDATDALPAALSSVILPPGPFSNFPGQDLNALTEAQPPDAAADVSPAQNAEFVNDLGLYVWNKPSLPVPSPAPTPTLTTSAENFWCIPNGVNGKPLPGCMNGTETLGLLSDTQIGYDSTLGRWLATEFAGNSDDADAAATITSASESGTTVTITTTGNPYGLVLGDVVTVAGVSVAGYNGNFAVTAIPSGTAFQYTTISGLGAGAGGTAQLPSGATIASASEAGGTVTVTTTGNPGLVLGAVVTIAGVSVPGYNGSFPVTAIPSGTTFQYVTAPGLAPSTGGTAQLVPSVGYLYFAASTTSSAAGSWNLWSIQGCTTNPSFPQTDQPLLGWSNSSVVVDLSCPQDSLPVTWGPDDILVIPNSTITSGSSTLPGLISAPCALMAPARDEQGSFADAFLLASIVPGSGIQTNAPNCAPASSNTAPYVVEYTANASGVLGSGGCAAGSSGCSPASISPQWGDTPPSYGLGLASQMGCSATTCEITLGDARITAAQIRPTNISGTNTPILTAGFATGIMVDGSVPQSQNIWVIQNPSSGSWLDLLSLSSGNQWYAFPTIASDGDQNYYLGSSLFSAGSYPATLWDSYVGIPGFTFLGQNFIEMSTSEYLGDSGQQPPVPPRWGDFNTMIYDPNAIPAGGGGSFWSVEESTCSNLDTTTCSNGSSDESTYWVALADPLPYFVGSNQSESECTGGAGSTCKITVTAPSGLQPGDVVLVGLLVGEPASNGPGLPDSSWTRLSASNISGDPNIIASEGCGGECVAAFLVAHIYTSSDSGSYTFTHYLNSSTEMGALLVAYRGASQTLANYTAYGFTSQNGFASSFSTGAVTPPAGSTLAALVSVDGGCDSPESKEATSLATSAPTGTPALTPETSLSDSISTFIEADAGVPSNSSQSYGPYKLTESPAGGCTSTGALWEAWEVAIPE
jgi:hypothetical protein